MMIPAVKLHESPLPTALLAKQPAVVEAVSKITTASMQAGVPLTTEQVKAVKDLIEAQRQAQETGGDESQDEDALRFIRGIKPSELLDEMGAKPKRTSNKIKKGITLRATGMVRERDAQKDLERQEKARKKADKRAAFKQSLREESYKPPINIISTPATEVVTAPVVTAGKTIEVSWKQRVSRKEVKEVTTTRTAALEQWFENNQPEGHGFHALKPRVEGNYRSVPVMQKATTTLADGTVVTLGYYERVWTKVPVGVSESQRERGVSDMHRSMFSRQEKKPKAVRSLVLSRMQDKLLGRGKAAAVAEVPWKTDTVPANDPMIVDTLVSAVSIDAGVSLDTGVIDYNDPARVARIRHRAYVGRYCRTTPAVTLRRVPGLPLLPRESIRKSFRATLAVRKARLTSDYDFFESGDYVARLQTNLLRNSTVAYLKDLHNGTPQRLFYSVEQSDDVGYMEQAARLEAFNDSIKGKEVLSASDIQQAVFDASHYRPDLRTKAQILKAGQVARKAAEDAHVKDWVAYNIKADKELDRIEGDQYLRAILSWMETNRARNDELDLQLQDAARYDAWLDKHAVFNHRDNELYDRWLQQHAAGSLLCVGRLMKVSDDWAYQAWLFDNAGDEFKLNHWLFDNNTPRADNVIDMMEWRHKNRKGMASKAAVKIGNTTPVKLILPVTPEISVHNSIMREHMVANDTKRDKEVTSFGKEVKDIRTIIKKFDKNKETGIYLPSYLLTT